jgi:hypothetical protein
MNLAERERETGEGRRALKIIEDLHVLVGIDLF